MAEVEDCLYLLNKDRERGREREHKRKAAGESDETEEADGHQAGERMLLPTRQAHSANELAAGSDATAPEWSLMQQAGVRLCLQVTLLKSEPLK